MRVDLPSAVRNPISLIGVAVTTAMAVVFLLLLTLEFTGQLTNPYAGLLVFVAVPFVFVIGLLLIPIGIWRQRRRVAAGYAPDDWPVIDLRLPRTRSVIVGVALLTIVNVFIVSLAGFGAVHHMESTEFCGQTCHTTMEPEWKAHQASPHSKVACVKCHVGPGASRLCRSQSGRHPPVVARHHQQGSDARGSARSLDADGARNLLWLPLGRKAAGRSPEGDPRLCRR